MPRALAFHIRMSCEYLKKKKKSSSVNLNCPARGQAYLQGNRYHLVSVAAQNVKLRRERVQRCKAKSAVSQPPDAGVRKGRGII